MSHPDQFDREDKLYPGDVHRLRRDIRRLRIDVRNLYILVVVVVGWLTAISLAGDLEDAGMDAASWPHAAYLSLEAVDPERHADTLTAAQMAVSHMTRTISLDSVLPVQVTPTLYRIPLDQLGWSEFPAIVHEQYPYGLTTPLVVRMDWFVGLLDQDRSNAYFRLLFGRQVTTLAEWFELLGVVQNSPEAYGWVEEESQIAVSRIRLIQSRPTTGRGDCYSTYDSARMGIKQDPLENLFGGLEFDASEHIAAMPKSYRGVMGHVQAYSLSNAAGELQSKAPASIVTDYTGTRGVEIVNAISCIVCHAEGLRPLTRSGVGGFVEAGAELYTDRSKQPEVERLYLMDLPRLIKKSNDDFGAVVTAITGRTPQEAADAVRTTVQAYDAPVSFLAAKRELGVSDGELTGALLKLTDSARLAILPSSPMPRDAFTQHFERLLNACHSIASGGDH